MIGVILCGGKSIRMGSDKGLLKLNNNTWAKDAADKLSELGLTVVCSVNKHQYPGYATIFDKKQLVKDNDTIDFSGPLYGLLSVHLQYPAEDLLVLACDMPLMEPILLKELLNQYQQNHKADAFVYSSEGEPEPLCGIYKAKALAHILQLHHSDELPKHSMKYMLEQISTQLIPVAEDQKKYFRNFNAHAELNGL